MIVTQRPNIIWNNALSRQCVNLVRMWCEVNGQQIIPFTFHQKHFITFYLQWCNNNQCAKKIQSIDSQKLQWIMIWVVSPEIIKQAGYGHIYHGETTEMNWRQQQQQQCWCLHCHRPPSRWPHMHRPKQHTQHQITDMKLTLLSETHIQIKDLKIFTIQMLSNM